MQLQIQVEVNCNASIQQRILYTSTASHTPEAADHCKAQNIAQELMLQAALEPLTFRALQLPRLEHDSYTGLLCCTRRTSHHQICSSVTELQGHTCCRLPTFQETTQSKNAAVLALAHKAEPQGRVWRTLHHLFGRTARNHITAYLGILCEKRMAEYLSDHGFSFSQCVVSQKNLRVNRE